jgi:tetratricopeptide (TPR) repeat protein
MAAERLSLKRFLTHLKDRHEGEKERPFCFILGAGASVQSDIPTGGQLVDRWLAEMHRDEATDGMIIEHWTKRTFGHIPDFTYERRAEYYGEIYDHQFGGREKAGHTFLESQLIGREPSFGYSILAWMLANSQHKAVITTDFDNLVSDALFLYSNTAPIICGHESLAGHVTPRLHRPLVVKIHRDILLRPLSAAGDINSLDRQWHEPLRTLLSFFTPIFIGYGGNDGSLMGFLESLPASVPDSIYWCVRAGAPPNARVTNLLDQRGRFLVEIPGFDELMLLLKEKLNIPDLLPDLDARHKARVGRYTQQFADLVKRSFTQSKAPDATADARALFEAATAAVQKTKEEDTPASWILRAQAEVDKDRAEALYREGLKHHPENGDLTTSFAEFLADQRQRFDEAESLFQTALERDPENPDHLHDYGTFLWYSRSDGTRAEPILRKAAAWRAEVLGPEHPKTLKSQMSIASALGVQGKSAEAEQEHRAVLAIRERVLSPEHPQTLASRNNLANMLQAQGKSAEAEQEHRAVLASRERVLGPEHLDTLSSRNNLAVALQAQSKSAEAEQEHRAVLASRERVLGPEHPHSLGSRMNLAIALQAQGKSAEAEQEDRAVLAIIERVLGPDHPHVFLSSYNLALALAGQKKYVEALRFARRAELGWQKALGVEHPNSLNVTKWRKIIEANIEEVKSE